MRPPRVRFTLRMLMILVAVAATWLFILAQSVAFQERHPPGGWSDSP